MRNLPVRKIVLYKHGVGFFKREGTIEGEQFSLTFKKDAVNDVLKSLAIFDRGDGQVLGIYYQTPMDKANRLSNSSIHLSDYNTLLDLLRDLRGRQVRLTHTEGMAEGQIVGVSTLNTHGVEKILVSIVQKENITILDLANLTGLAILDEQAQHDLHYVLETNMEEDNQRHVNVRLSEGDHHLVIYYIAPSPTWRVSYRLIAERNEESDTGSALLQGWGLFDNRLDEDLEDVSVTLVAGQPISFIYDLYTSRIPHRPTVQDDVRTVSRPVEFRGGSRKRSEAPSDAVFYSRQSLGDVPEAEEAPDAFLMMDAAAGSPVAAEGTDAGEFFQYVVTTPVTVKRGDSAMVPILGASLPYTRILLYNGSKLEHHPVAAMQFTNTTGLTLERGPITLIEDNNYIGEAIVDFTPAGSDLYLAYAVELGVNITEQVRRRTQMAGLSIEDRFLLIEDYQVEHTNYTLENNTQDDLTITIEAPVRGEYLLFDTPEPVLDTGTIRRWEVSVPADTTTTFTRSERRQVWRRQEIRQLQHRQLLQYIQEKWLDEQTFNQLDTLLNTLAEIEAARSKRQDLLEERSSIYERQAHLRENLNTLSTEGDEAQLRQRMLHQLEVTEDRLQEIDAQTLAYEEAIETYEADVQQMIESLPSS